MIKVTDAQQMIKAMLSKKEALFPALWFTPYVPMDGFHKETPTQLLRDV
jgi:hypothetical protein